MSKKQGEWVKFRERPRYSPEGKEAVREQHSKVSQAGVLIKERCTGKKGDEFKRCRSEVLKEIFGQKTESGQDK
jgi:hypothetical protein